jgi:predicted alpha-1,2-mannosidase
MANALDKKEDYEYFLSRSKSFANIVDTITGYIRPRNSDSSWAEPFDPLSSDLNNGFTEASPLQYSWFIPQNITRLIDIMGGREFADRKLDSLFNIETIPSITTPVDVTGLIGQYAQGNEPCHHIPYLYNYISKPWKTQRVVHRIMDSLYNSTPSGLCGNDDCGQLSAWYVLSCMGFYPVNPANGIFDIGSPLFPKVELNLDNGKKFLIVANDVSKSNYYIQSIYLNEEIFEEFRLSFMDIIKGGSLEFTMDNKPYIKGE